RDRRGTDGLRPRQLLDRFRRPVEDHALVVTREKPVDHVGAHAAESDHSELHHRLLCRAACSASSVSFFVLSMAARRRFIALATPSRSLKIDEPATSTVAPARTTRGAVVASIPPSTSTSQPGLRRSTSSRTRSIFGSVVRMNCWWPKPGLTVMTSTWSRSWTISSSTAPGVAGLMATAALAERPDALHRAMQITVALPVDEERVGARRGELVQKEVRIRDHQMRPEGQTPRP